MTYRYDPDDVIATWAAESTGGGKPDYLPEVLLMVERTPQHRWARWVPGAGTTSPAKAPAMNTRAVLVVAAALLLLLVGGALVAGSLRRPTFSLQSVVPLPAAEGTIFVGTSDDAIWATVVDGVLSIDPKTGVATRHEVPFGGTDITGVVATSEAIWAADYFGNRIMRLDRATGELTAETSVVNPAGMQLDESGLWVLDKVAGLVRINPSTGVIEKRLPPAYSFAVVPGALWYITRSETGPAATEAFAVEVDPVTGEERRRIPIPVDAARWIAIDTASNPWVYQRRSDRSVIAAIDAAKGTVGTPFAVPYDVIGGVVPIGSSMWAITAANNPEGARIVELGRTGPTGRAETLDDGLDPDGPAIAFGSIWIPWEGKGVLYQYPLDALAP